MRRYTEEASLHVLDKNPYKGIHSHMHIIENSNHLLYFDNPKGLTDAILKDLENIR
jgi:pimeloyl-ACP methyl ester carboxylesterase